MELCSTLQCVHAIIQELNSLKVKNKNEEIHHHLKRWRFPVVVIRTGLIRQFQRSLPDGDQDGLAPTTPRLGAEPVGLEGLQLVGLREKKIHDTIIRNSYMCWQRVPAEITFFCVCDESYVHEKRKAHVSLRCYFL